MIAFLTGRLVEKGPDYAVLDVHGVGYRMAMSTTSLSALPAQGDEVTVLTHLHVREDDLSLFGFESASEKSLFAALITVSGVGPKVALAALSTFPPDELVSAIVCEDIAAVSSISGIGNKTAQRIILELKDKLGTAVDGAGSGQRATGGSGAGAAQAREALVSMGFSPPEIASALKGYEGDSENAQALLKHALKRIGGGS